MTGTAVGEGEYELSHYLKVLWRRKLSILGPMVALAIIGYLLGSELIVSYTSTAEVLAKPVEPAVSSVSGAVKDTASIGDEIAIISSDAVELAAEKEVGHDIDLAVTQQSAEINLESSVVVITVTGEEDDVKADAQAIADTYVSLRRDELVQGATTATATLTERLAGIDTDLAALAPQITDLDAQILAQTDEIVLRGLNSQRDDLIFQREGLNNRRADVQGQLDDLELTTAVNPTLGVEVLSDASDAELAEGATQVQYASAGLALGLILGVLLAFAREHFDRSVRTPRDIKPGVRVLGVVPRHSQGAAQ